MGTDDLFKKRKAKEKARIKRRAELFESYDRVLIICEGSKTEPIYLEALRTFLDLSQTNIVIDPNSDASPSSVVAYALQKIKEERENPYDRVFCVVDRDTHGDFDKAIDMAKRFRSKATRLETIVSDPCFEYWLLLHFEYATTLFGAGEKSPCRELISDKLSVYLSDYQKSDSRIITSLINPAQLKQAIAYAKRSYESAQRDGRKSPLTQVHMLIEYLMNLKGFTA
jgi:hypothetical protein